MEGRKGGSEGGYYKGREEWVEGGREGKGISSGGREGGTEGGREGGREREVITKGGREGITKGGMDGWKDEYRDGRYYKGSGEAGRVGWMEGGSEGGRENITNELIETVIREPEQSRVTS